MCYWHGEDLGGGAGLCKVGIWKWHPNKAGEQSTPCSRETETEAKVKVSGKFPSQEKSLKNGKVTVVRIGAWETCCQSEGEFIRGKGTAGMKHTFYFECGKKLLQHLEQAGDGQQRHGQLVPWKMTGCRLEKRWGQEQKQRDLFREYCVLPGKHSLSLIWSSHHLRKEGKIPGRHAVCPLYGL